ncbi:MAG: glutathione S-transferase family protein [Sphingomonas sp.]
MTLELYGHAFSSYTWKALIALYEKDTPFTFRPIDPDHADNGATLARLSPMGKFPLLTDGDRAVFEATAIIEYLDAAHPGAVRFVPADPLAAVEVRMLDRVFDNYVMTPMSAIVANALRPEDSRDPYGVEQARAALDRIYAWLDNALADREWAAGDAFTLADCAAAPSLFYADWTHPMEGRFPTLAAYRARLLARPSVARCVDEGRPYRAYFPLGAPDRD